MSDRQIDNLDYAYKNHTRIMELEAQVEKMRKLERWVSGFATRVNTHFNGSDNVLTLEARALLSTVGKGTSS